jgi:hypothetical protein
MSESTTTLEISIAGANCPWCLNETLDALRAHDGVVSVATSITSQCLRVEHDGVDDAFLLAIVRRHLHADGTSSAEHVMTAVDAVVADIGCRHA